MQVLRRFKKSGRAKGQSFIELALILPLLLIMLAGMVEVGMVMFSYMTALDLTREAARFASTRDYRELNVDDASGLPGSACVDHVLHYYYDTACFFVDPTLNPFLTFDPARYDDVVITVLTITNNHVSDRHPSPTGSGHWSLYNDNWTKDCHGNTIRSSPFFSNADIENQFATNAPTERGIVIVEAYYCYDLILNFPIISSVMPSPIPAPCLHDHASLGSNSNSNAYPSRSLKGIQAMFRKLISACKPILLKAEKSQRRRYCQGVTPQFSGLPGGGTRGQALVLLAISFFALLAFIGLVTDVGSIYVSYSQLQRAVDSAAVAAANNIKYPQASAAERKQKITESAREMLAEHHITGVSALVVYLCDDTGRPTQFAAICPSPSQPPRKLAWIQATQMSPVYFLQIFGVRSFPLTASAVGEAAAVDLVLVFDTSESMGVTSPGYDPNNFNPATCNAANNCQPLKQAKDAAKNLVNNLFDGYDQVALVTFNYTAHIEFNLSTDLSTGASGALYAIDHHINLHDDPPNALMAWSQPSPGPYPSSGPVGYKTFNPIFPEDRDGNGVDADPGKPCVDVLNNINADPNPDLWDDNTGEPCDSDTVLDVYDWNNDGIRDGNGAPAAPAAGNQWNFEPWSLSTTCSGCGIRLGTDVLKGSGRPTAVWVIVYLSDGVANLSDTYTSSPLTIPNSSNFRYGFCGSDPATAFWGTYCIDRKYWVTPPSAPRYCIDTNGAECPPGATHTTTTGPYSVEDYAQDMVDTAALLESDNSHEPRGEDIVLYSIGLGNAASMGEHLLRYIANVGDEGSRGNDQCAGIATKRSCGNYYYAPNASYLAQIFESIANRIFTKISR